MAPREARMSGQDTNTLLELARAGVEEAWDVLYEKYQRFLRTWIRRRLPRHVRPRIGADDILQVVFLAAVTRIHRFQYRGKGSFGAWLERIASNELALRAKRQVAQSLADPTLYPDESVPDPAERASDKELVNRAIRMICELDERDQAILFQRIMLGEKWLAIACPLGLSVPATQRRFRAAVLRLGGKVRRLENLRTAAVREARRTNGDLLYRGA